MILASHRQTSAPLRGLLPLWDILGVAGLQANAQFCLDAGDAASWPGGGQKWLDRSAGGYDFFLGETASVEASDPAFVGAAGNLTSGTYWSWDGAGDRFRYDAAPEAFMHGWHKAGATYTFLALVYVAGAPAVASALLATLDSAANVSGVNWGVGGGTTKQNIFVLNGSTPVLQRAADAAPPQGWHMMAVSINAVGGAGSGFFYQDGSYAQVGGADTFNAAYSGPASSNANGCKIGVDAGNYYSLPAGTRLMGLVALNRATSKAELDAVWALARRRLGL